MSIQTIKMGPAATATAGQPSTVGLPPRAPAPEILPSPRDEAMRAQPTPAERWQALAEHLENYVRQSGRNLRFQVDERSGRVVVKVIDAENGTV
ncbi:MAG: flagellar protein FlaG, partial [Steroidobacteraceae bacterium]|nr:flagellar protein FlaG [Steroidobacteraceae bacterium]